MVFVESDDVPVAVACALEREEGWRELAWVAVASVHRGKGLGSMVCSALIRHLLASDEQRIFGSTQDERLAALRIYLEMGFYPVHREDKVERWHAICNNLSWPFRPQLWGWPLEIN
jgi:mycothiol synthase